MSDTADTANVIVRPPIVWALAVLVGLTLQWVVSLPFMPASVPAGWIGGIVFVLALALFAWAIATMTRAGSNVPTNLPTTTIVETGPYRFTRNPIYLGMFLGLVSIAIAFDNLWLLVMLVPFTLVIRYGVAARKPISSASSATPTASTARACGAGCRRTQHRKGPAPGTRLF
jgi:protein-S-isoprenylcysteine O-methyltransferase Ste14